MIFEIAFRMIRVNGCHELDSALLKIIHDPTNRIRILLNDLCDFRRELAAIMKINLCWFDHLMPHCDHRHHLYRTPKIVADVFL